MTHSEASDEALLRSAAERGDVQAAFSLIAILDQRGDFAGSAAILGEAARKGALDAIAELGARTALGAGVAVDFSAAGALLEFAAERCQPSAPRWLARLAVAGALDESVGPRAVNLLAQNARAGDFASLEDLAQLAGEHGEPREGGIDAYAAAAQPGVWTAPLSVEWISQSPRIGRCDGVLPATVCQRIVADARPALAPAGVTDRKSGEFAIDAARTNTSAQAAFFAQPMALVMAKRRIAALAGEPALHLERTNILRYRTGEAFAPHWDYLDPEAEGFADELATQGQRVATCLIGLLENYSDGETDFPDLAVRVRIPAGGALFFRNVDEAGRPDPRTRHAGRPVIEGEKWVISQWVRTRPHPL